MGVVPCQMEGFFPTDEIMIELLKAVDRKKGIHDEFIKMKDYKELLENNPFAVIDALRDVKNLYFLTGFTGTLTEINTITGQTDQDFYENYDMFIISLEHSPFFFSAPYSSQIDAIEELKQDLAALMPYLEMDPNLTRNWGRLFGTIDC